VTRAPVVGPPPGSFRSVCLGARVRVPRPFPAPSGASVRPALVLSLPRALAARTRSLHPASLALSSVARRGRHPPPNTPFVPPSRLPKPRSAGPLGRCGRRVAACSPRGSSDRSCSCRRMTTDTLRKGIGGRSEDIARDACSLTIRNTLPKGAFALQTASRVVPPLRTARCWVVTAWHSVLGMRPSRKRGRGMPRRASSAACEESWRAAVHSDHDRTDAPVSEQARTV
jgi:hypothetical protein